MQNNFVWASRRRKLCCGGDIATLTPGIPPRSEFRRTFSVNDRARHRDVRKLLTIHGATQHQSATAHVTTPNKLRRESQSVAKIRQQNIYVFARGNAAEK